ncbi:MAG: bifunctional class I SAM-dependent methyltransferase/glycosyltransferase family 2 protein [Verrucomicrobia subdivision 3 bacterium]|nr:bifunctional class I SAM-dependent methyltransferase/glycosyltransferase family 2 protein [Limisphaerales bacterium]
MIVSQRLYECPASRLRRPGTSAFDHLLRLHYSFLVPEGMRVLDLSCGNGDLLAALKPRRGVGIDANPQLLTQARECHPDLEFASGDQPPRESEKFDYILLGDLPNYVTDVQSLLERIHRHSYQHTRIVLSLFNHLWRPFVALGQRLTGRSATLPQNWISARDMENLLNLAGWEIIKTDSRILWPFKTPLLEPLFNRWLAPLLKHLCLTVFMVARPRPLPSLYRNYTCTVVIPARNEAGNIEAAVQRIPELGTGTEIIFVEGHSTDNTWEEIQRAKDAYPHRDIKIIKQQSQGKGGAVREAFAQATGDILFILDADLTVPPEDLTKFYNVICTGTADFVNGVRLLYPMENEAMRFLNMVANKFFSLAFSWLLGQPIKDTLCGTKVLFRAQYEQIARNRSYFGDFDPFGDFDLLFGAAKLNLRMLDLPIRYRARTYGETNISRWRHGWLLLRMVRFAAMRLKFIG